MSGQSRPRVIVLGGAGFIGSHIVDVLVADGADVCVIDGMIPGTGGRIEHLQHLSHAIEVVIGDVGTLGHFQALLRSCDVVIDALAWTSHVLAMEDPLRDLRLNCESHLHVIRALPIPAPRVVFLGSRGQYGRPATAAITENTPLVPEDVQGIHKTAAESYYRVFSEVKGLNVRSLRFANCFGERGPLDVADAGLVGGFIRTLLVEGRLIVYGEGRTRNVLYARDLATIVAKLVATDWLGFTPFNVSGYEVTVEELARALVTIHGKGDTEIRPLPPRIAALDGGAATFDDSLLRQVLGNVPRTSLTDALQRTLRDYAERLR